MNAVDAQFVIPIFDGALEAGTHYSSTVPTPISSTRMPFPP